MIAHICPRCAHLDDEELGRRCPCMAPHDVAAARRRLRDAIGRARRTDAVTAAKREAAA